MRFFFHLMLQLLKATLVLWIFIVLGAVSYAGATSGIPFLLPLEKIKSKTDFSKKKTFDEQLEKWVGPFSQLNNTEPPALLVPEGDAEALVPPAEVILFSERDQASAEELYAREKSLLATRLDSQDPRWGLGTSKPTRKLHISFGKKKYGISIPSKWNSPLIGLDATTAKTLDEILFCYYLTIFGTAYESFDGSTDVLDLALPKGALEIMRLYVIPQVLALVQYRFFVLGENFDESYRLIAIEAENGKKILLRLSPKYVKRVRNAETLREWLQKISLRKLDEKGKGSAKSIGPTEESKTEQLELAKSIFYHVFANPLIEFFASTTAQVRETAFGEYFKTELNNFSLGYRQRSKKADLSTITKLFFENHASYTGLFLNELSREAILSHAFSYEKTAYNSLFIVIHDYMEAFLGMVNGVRSRLNGEESLRVYRDLDFQNTVGTCINFVENQYHPLASRTAWNEHTVSVFQEEAENMLNTFNFSADRFEGDTIYNLQQQNIEEKLDLYFRTLLLLGSSAEKLQLEIKERLESVWGAISFQLNAESLIRDKLAQVEKKLEILHAANADALGPDVLYLLVDQQFPVQRTHPLWALSKQRAKEKDFKLVNLTKDSEDWMDEPRVTRKSSKSVPVKQIKSQTSRPLSHSESTFSLFSDSSVTASSFVTESERETPSIELGSGVLRKDTLSAVSVFSVFNEEQEKTLVAFTKARRELDWDSPLETRLFMDVMGVISEKYDEETLDLNPEDQIRLKKAADKITSMLGPAFRKFQSIYGRLVGQQKRILSQSRKLLERLESFPEDILLRETSADCRVDGESFVVGFSKYMQDRNTLVQEMDLRVLLTSRVLLQGYEHGPLSRNGLLSEWANNFAKLEEQQKEVNESKLQDRLQEKVFKTLLPALEQFNENCLKIENSPHLLFELKNENEHLMALVSNFFQAKNCTGKAGNLCSVLNISPKVLQQYIKNRELLERFEELSNKIAAEATTVLDVLQDGKEYTHFLSAATTSSLLGNRGQLFLNDFGNPSETDIQSRIWLEIWKFRPDFILALAKQILGDYWERSLYLRLDKKIPFGVLNERTRDEATAVASYLDFEGTFTAILKRIHTRFYRGYIDMAKNSGYPSHWFLWNLAERFADVQPAERPDYGIKGGYVRAFYGSAFWLVSLKYSNSHLLGRPQKLMGAVTYEDHLENNRLNELHLEYRKKMQELKRSLENSAGKSSRELSQIYKELNTLLGNYYLNPVETSSRGRNLLRFFRENNRIGVDGKTIERSDLDVNLFSNFMSHLFGGYSYVRKKKSPRTSLVENSIPAEMSEEERDSLREALADRDLWNTPIEMENPYVIQFYDLLPHLSPLDRELFSELRAFLRKWKKEEIFQRDINLNFYHYYSGDAGPSANAQTGKDFIFRSKLPGTNWEFAPF